MRELKFRYYDSVIKSFVHSDDFDWKLPTERLAQFFMKASSYSTGKIYQFTGFKDKKEEKIYEGDILKLKIHDEIVPANNREIKATVEWDNYYGAWKVVTVGGDSYLFGINENCWVEASESKIVGNTAQL